MTLQSRVIRLEAAQPKHLLIGLTITQAGRVLGIAPFSTALEHWARTGEPKRTTALIFSHPFFALGVLQPPPVFCLLQ